MADNFQKLTLQAPQHRFIGAEQGDLHLPLSISGGDKPLEQFDLSAVVNLHDLTQQERNSSTLYRIHGTINHVSFLNNRPISWTNLKTLYDEEETMLSFNSQYDIRVCYVADYQKLPNGFHRQWLKPLSDPLDVDWLACGFAQNTFREKLTNFVLSKPINIDGLVTKGLWSDLPVTELFLMVVPKADFRVNVEETPPPRDLSPNTPSGFSAPLVPGKSILDAIKTHLLPASFSTIGSSGIGNIIYPELYSLFKLTDKQLTPATIIQNKIFLQSWFGLNNRVWFPSKEAAQRDDGLFAGDIVIVDYEDLTVKLVAPISYQMNKQIKEVKTLARQAQFSALGYRLGGDRSFLTLDTYYEIQAFYPLPIRAYSDYLETGKTEEVTAIPAHAKKDSDDVFHWRDLLDVGYQELETGRGIDYPFINGTHYYYAQPLIIVRPDLSDYNTFRIFQKAKGGLSPIK